jgi:hypothetical protein
MSNPTTVTKPFLPPLEEFTPYLKKIWASHVLTNGGQFHQELEQALCEYLGVKYISLFSNGTLSLIIALQALKITGEVITTPFSFVATTHALWCIKRFVQIGAGSIILPNLVINQGVAVGAMSFVRENLDEWNIYGGNPLKMIKPRDKKLLKHYEELLRRKKSISKRLHDYL